MSLTVRSSTSGTPRPVASSITSIVKGPPVSGTVAVASSAISKGTIIVKQPRWGRFRAMPGTKQGAIHATLHLTEDYPRRGVVTPRTRLADAAVDGLGLGLV